MEISGSNYNKSVNFFPANTGKNTNILAEGENHIYSSENILQENFLKISGKTVSSPIKKRRKSKRLNTIDSEYLYDEPDIKEAENKSDNFFIEKEKNEIWGKIKKSFCSFYMKTPLINYFFLKNKKHTIQKTVEKLNDINQNVDELLNSGVPYGEEKTIYTDIAQNLTDAALLLGKVNKNL